MNLSQSIDLLKQKSLVRGNTRRSILRPAVHLLGLAHLLELGLLAFSGGLGVNPIQFIEQFLGRAAANLLVLALAVTPVVTLTGWKALSRHRRTFGLYAFLYFLLHLLTFIVLDYGLNWPEIARFSLEKPFILIGLAAGLILIILAATSFRYWMKRLGKNWKLLHRSVYLAGGLMVLHYAMAVKGSLTNLSGEVYRPLAMGLLVTFLLVLRIPPVKKWVISIRKRLSQKESHSSRIVNNNTN